MFSWFVRATKGINEGMNIAGNAEIDGVFVGAVLAGVNDSPGYIVDVGILFAVFKTFDVDGATGVEVIDVVVLIVDGVCIGVGGLVVAE